MTGLRTRIEDAIIVHTERCDCCPLVGKPEKLADVVLRVLAEHGDTQQVREQVESLPGPMITVDQVMAVVAPIVAARDAAVERAEEAEAERDAAVKSRNAWLWLSDAAARQQLDQVRALATGFDTDDAGLHGKVLAANILRILDAPARPAEHDETGQ